MISVGQVCRDHAPTFYARFCYDGCITDACNNSVSYREMMLVGLGVAHKLRQQSALTGHLFRKLDMLCRIKV
jgi:hypothetical protein